MLRAKIGKSRGKAATCTYIGCWLETLIKSEEGAASPFMNGFFYKLGFILGINFFYN